MRIVALEENIGEESIGKTVSTMQAHTTDIMVTVADIKKDIEEIYKSTNLCSKACVERISILEVKAVNSERGRAALWGVLIFVLSGLGTLILHHIFGGK